MKTLRIFFVLAASSIFVSSCASTSQNTQAGSKTLEAKSDSDFVTYRDCMKKAADNYSASTATPHEIADAAQSKCGTEFHAFEKSMENFLTYDKVTAAGHSAALRASRDLAQEMKGQTKEKVVQWVLDNRLKKK